MGSCSSLVPPQGGTRAPTCWVWQAPSADTSITGRAELPRFPMFHYCCYPKTPFPCSYTPFPFDGMRGPGTAPQPGPRHRVQSSSFCLCLLLPGYFYPWQWAGAVLELQPPVGLGVRAGAMLASWVLLEVWLSAVGKQGDVPVSWGWGQQCHPAEFAP